MSIAESAPSPLLASSTPTPLGTLQGQTDSGWHSSELPLIGRAIEVAQIKQHLMQSTFVTLVGMGGIGKTRVAMQVAQEFAPARSLALYWVNLANVNSLQAWESALAQALGILLPNGQPGLPHLATHLHSHATLLVLDGFEHLIDRVIWLTQLQAHAANDKLHILVTSRERLNIPNEVVVDLRGLSTQPSDPTQGNDLSPAEALFLYHANKAQSGYVMTTDDRQHVNRICTLVNGIPLAIELAAAWIGLFPTRFIAEQIQRNLDWLTTSVGITHGPQQSMRAAIEYFWMRLSTHEQRCLRQLSVFRDGFDRILAQTITSASDFFLNALMDRALLIRQPTGRYTLPAMLRQFAEEQLNQNPIEANDIRQRHAQAMFELLHRISEAWLSQNDSACLQRFEAEQDNIRAAIQWAIANQASEIAIKMASQTSVFCQQLGDFKMGIQLLNDTLAMLPQPVNGDHFRALLAQAGLQFAIGEFSAAVITIQQVLQYVPTGLPERDDLNSQALTLMAEIETRQGSHLNAQSHAREAVQAAQHAKNITTLANAMLCEGRVFQDTSNYLQATQSCQEALILHQRARNQLGIATVHLDLGHIYLVQKETAAAARAFSQAHTIYAQLGNRLHTARALLCMGAAFHEQRDFATARGNAEKALAVFKELGAQECVVQAQLLLGNIALEQNQNPEPFFLLGLDGALRLGLMPRMLLGLCGVARARMHNGRNTSALELIGLLLSHVASTSAIVQEANAMLAQLRRLLSHNEVERHLASGQRRNLHHTVREMLAEGTVG